MHLADSASGTPVQARSISFAIYPTDPPGSLAPGQSVDGSTDVSGNGTFCYHVQFLGTWQIQLLSPVIIDQNTYGTVNVPPVRQTWVQPTITPPPPDKVEMDTTVSVSTDTVVVGDTATLHYAVVNNGRLFASHYAFHTTVQGPAGFVSATSSRGSCSLEDGLLCDGLFLLPQSTLTVDAVIRPLAPGQITIESDWVAEPFADPLWQFFASSGGSASLTAVQRTADLGVTFRTVKSQAGVGQPTRAVVIITNIGPHTALDATLRLTAAHLLVTKAPGQPAIGCSGKVLTCKMPPIAANATQRIYITWRGTARGRAKLIAHASSTASDPNSANNTVVAGPVIH